MHFVPARCDTRLPPRCVRYCLDWIRCVLARFCLPPLRLPHTHGLPSRYTVAWITRLHELLTTTLRTRFNDAAWDISVYAISLPFRITRYWFSTRVLPYVCDRLTLYAFVLLLPDYTPAVATHGCNNCFHNALRALRRTPPTVAACVARCRCSRVPGLVG